MPTLDKSNFNIVCATLGGFITLFGLVSYLFKERLFLSEALISLLAGVTFSPHAIGLIKPLDYTSGSQDALNEVTHAFTRLVLGVQLVLAGVQLPSKYLLYQWKPLALLLGPGMTGMWVCSSVLIWALVPSLPFLHALAVAACVTPTDPVLSNSIVKGKFADKNVPRELQRIIIAESGANDGLGYPFLYLALFLIKYVGDSSSDITPAAGGAGAAMGQWFSETWCYQIGLGVAYGATVGWIAKELLHWAEEHKYVDRESFLVFAITLALFIVGTCGMIGSDDVLACFIAGNAFTIDDWFRLETLDDSLQPTIDMLLNLAVFMWFGAVCPWPLFGSNAVIPPYRLVPLGVLILLLRRLPVVMLMRSRIPQIDDVRQALFVGFFGPIGVSAIFYLFVALQFLATLTSPDGSPRADAAALAAVLQVVVWFLAICSIVVHGLSVPLGKLGYHLPRTISSAWESRASADASARPSFQLADAASSGARSPAPPSIVSRFDLLATHGRRRAAGPRHSPNHPSGSPHRPAPPPAFRIGGSKIPLRDDELLRAHAMHAAEHLRPRGHSGSGSGSGSEHAASIDAAVSVDASSPGPASSPDTQSMGGRDDHPRNDVERDPPPAASNGVRATPAQPPPAGKVPTSPPPSAPPSSRAESVAEDGRGEVRQRHAMPSLP